MLVGREEQVEGLYMTKVEEGEVEGATLVTLLNSGRFVMNFIHNISIRLAELPLGFGDSDVNYSDFSSP